MTPDQAMFALQLFIKDYETERPITQRVLGALPDSGAQYQPDPKARKAVELAYHIANSESWFLNSIVLGSFIPGDVEAIPAELAKPSAIAAWYPKIAEEGLAKVKKMAPDQAAKVMDFFGIFQLPAAMFMTFMSNHTIHHRGQLSAYLRPAGGKVPDIYGGSADEPWKGV